MRKNLVTRLAGACGVAALLMSCGGGGDGGGDTNILQFTWSTPVQLSRNPAGTPQVATDDAGNAAAIWYQRPDPGATWYHADPGWGPAREYSLGDSAVANSIPCMGMDAQGRALAVWSRGSTVQGTRHTVAQGWLEPETLDTTAGVLTDPCVAVNRGGSGLAVWRETVDAVATLRFSRYTPASGWQAAANLPGAQPGAAGGALPFGGQAPYYAGNLRADPPQVAIDGSGRGMATWIDTTGALRAAAYLPATGWLAPQTVVASGAAGSITTPLVGMDDSGRAVLAWRQAAPNAGVWTAQAEAGGSWSAPQRRDAGPAVAALTGEPTPLALHVHASGEGRLAWIEPATTNNVVGNLWSARLTGGAWSAADRPANSDNAGAPSITVDSRGRAVLAWSHKPPFPDTAAIRSAAFTPGRGWLNLNDLHLAGEEYSLRPSVSLSASGRAAIVWAEGGSCCSAFRTLVYGATGR